MSALLRSVFLMLALATCVFSVSEKGRDYLHQEPGGHKDFPGWQEPGFNRPRYWIMDRTFFDKEGNVLEQDRIQFRTFADRSMKFLKQSNRPLFDWVGKFSKSRKPANKDERTLADKLYYDGTWSFKDFSGPAADSSYGLFGMDTKEDEASEDITRYDCRVKYGKTDGYSILFQPGQITRFSGFNSKARVHIGAEVIGSFSIRANVNRPICSKDFQAFQ